MTPVLKTANGTGRAKCRQGCGVAVLNFKALHMPAAFSKGAGPNREVFGYCRNALPARLHTCFFARPNRKEHDGLPMRRCGFERRDLGWREYVTRDSDNVGRLINALNVYADFSVGGNRE